MESGQKLRTLPFMQELISPVAYENYIAALEPIINGPAKYEATSKISTGNAFLDAMSVSEPAAHTDASDSRNRMLTENLGVTHSSSQDPLVDLFYELEKSVKPERLGTLLENAWKADADSTLKLIFHARSIANGKGERESFYRCVGWLVERGHWRTVLRNLEALVAPLARKPKPKAEVTDEQAAEEEAELDAHNARSTGYYKDLANLLVLSASGELRIDGDMVIIPGCSATTNRKREYTRKRTRKFGRRIDAAMKAEEETLPEDKVAGAISEKTDAAGEEGKRRLDEANRSRNKAHQSKAKELRSIEKDEHFAKVQTALGFEEDDEFDPEESFHRALHVTVARLFATQLVLDAEHLAAAQQLKEAGKTEGAEKRARKVSVAAKWAPTFGHSHDRYTFIASSIAEILDGGESLNPNQTSADRAAVMPRVLADYRRRYLSPLRAHLDIVERHMSANRWSDIRYPRVPSLAMHTYSGLFYSHDKDRFDKFLDAAAAGKASVSGATLTPAKLVKEVRAEGVTFGRVRAIEKPNAMTNKRMAHVQWQTMVREVRESGQLENAIAVADVSGSMTGPIFSDGTSPMDSSIGLSLLLAQVAEPPFRNHVITFSASPTFITLEEGMDLKEAVGKIGQAPWGMSTDFLKVFRMILDKARIAKVSPEAMVKRVFVFSDMEFDSASRSTIRSGSNPWETHYEILQREYAAAGYKLPELVFWNLAGGRTGLASKPVEHDTPGTALVSGYSSAMVKLFMDGSELNKAEEAEAEGEGEWEKVGTEGEGEGEEPAKKKRNVEPVDMMKKAIAHESFVGIKVYD